MTIVGAWLRCGDSLPHADWTSIEDEFLGLGVYELFEDPEAPKAWTIVEWADRVGDVMPRDTLWIEITIEEDASRRSVACTTTDPRKIEAIGRMIEDLDRG
jgi:tRNA A37 threonylcarbamoyladenosine biosynthesis protein TsaE